MLGYLDISKSIVVACRMLRRKEGSSREIPRSFIDNWVLWGRNRHTCFCYILHLTSASGIGVGHAGCAEFSFFHSAEFSFLSLSSVRFRQVLQVSQVSRERVCVSTVTYVRVRLIGRIEGIESCDWVIVSLWPSGAYSLPFSVLYKRF